LVPVTPPTLPERDAQAASRKKDRALQAHANELG
jgi:hypothetical protein